MSVSFTARSRLVESRWSPHAWSEDSGPLVRQHLHFFRELRRLSVCTSFRPGRRDPRTPGKDTPSTKNWRQNWVVNTCQVWNVFCFQHVPMDNQCTWCKTCKSISLQNLLGVPTEECDGAPDVASVTSQTTCGITKPDNHGRRHNS